MKMHSRILACGLAVLLASSVFIAGCEQEKPQQPDFSNVEYIAELATMDCYYHNVCKQEKDGILFFDRKAWFEYSGIVTLGIDASKVSVSEPDMNGKVTITIPPARVLGVNVETESFTDPITHMGPLTRDFTAEERNQAYAETQAEMREMAENDDALKAKARQRAKSLLEEYVKNVGNEIGQEYTVTWKDVE